MYVCMYVCREQQQEDDRVGGGRITTKAVKNIAQALARIRELEDEITKTKVGYCCYT